MIRRDYILRMIQQFCEALSRIQSLKKAEQWEQATDELEQQFRLLTGMDRSKIVALSETELRARLMLDEPSVTVRDKTFMMASLLKTAGDVAAGENRIASARAFHLKGLHLLLGLLAHEDVGESPQFVPAVEQYVLALQDAELPPETLALLMQHYERTGEFGKAEDALFELLEAWPGDSHLLNFGVAFYERLGRQSDAQLTAGNLPRAELETALAELRRQKEQPVYPAKKP